MGEMAGLSETAAPCRVSTEFSCTRVQVPVRLACGCDLTVLVVAEEGGECRPRVSCAVDIGLWALAWCFSCGGKKSHETKQ